MFTLDNGFYSILPVIKRNQDTEQYLQQDTAT